MQMVVVIFRQSLETEILAVLRACHVPTFTEVAEVLGVGETGRALHTFSRPGSNSMVLAALAEPDAERTIVALRSFRDRTAAQRRGAGVPLHVFVLPCEQVL